MPKLPDEWGGAEQDVCKGGNKGNHVVVFGAKSICEWRGQEWVVHSVVIGNFIT